jgi:hypothetical protein
MVERTSTGNAPWTLVEANDKSYARVKILRTLAERLESELAKGDESGSKSDSKKSKKSSKHPSKA